MGTATHLGPWLLGTVKDTTGTTAGTVKNTGATIVAQQKAVVYTDGSGVAFGALPAGALVVRAEFVTTTTFTAATTVVVKVGGVAINSATTVTTGGLYPITISNTQAVGQAISVGTSDVLVTYDLAPGISSAGAGTLVVEYIVRNSDGTIGATP